MQSLVEKKSPFEWYRYAGNLFGVDTPDPGFGEGIGIVLKKLLFLNPSISGSGNLLNPNKSSLDIPEHESSSRFDAEIQCLTRGPNIDIVGQLGIEDIELGLSLLRTMLTLTLSVFGADEYNLTEHQRGGLRWFRVKHPLADRVSGINIIPTSPADLHISHSNLRQALLQPIQTNEKGHLTIPNYTHKVGKLEFSRFQSLGQALFFASKTTLTLASNPGLGYVTTDKSFAKLPRKLPPRQALHTAINFALAHQQNKFATQRVVTALDLGRFFDINDPTRVSALLPKDTYPPNFIQLLSYYLPTPIDRLIKQLESTPTEIVHTYQVPVVRGHLFAAELANFYQEAVDAIKIILRQSTSTIPLTPEDFIAISSDSQILRNPPIFT